MKDTVVKEFRSFLNGGGEMGELIRSMDWNNTSLGPPENWPQNLKTSLGIILNSKFPMFIWWGEDLICFYNDAYRPSLGINGKHPSILGMKAKDAWPEIWSTISPMIEQVMINGEAIWNEDQLVPIYRNGKIEDVYWTYSYSAIPDQNGKTSGVLVTCFETTLKVNTLKYLEESNRRFFSHIMQAPVAMCIFNGPDHVVKIANDQMLALMGKTSEEIINTKVLHEMPELEDQGIKELLDSVYFKGEKITATEKAIDLVRKDHIETIYLDFICEPLYETEGKITGVVAVATDVTQKVLLRKKAEESELRFRNVADSAPVMIWMLSDKKERTFFNKAFLEFTGLELNEARRYVWSDGIHPDDTEKCDAIFMKAFKRQEGFYMEYRMKRGDGEYRWVSDNGVPRFTSDGKFEGYIGACMDIHDQTIYRKKIKENEEKLNIVISASELGAWELNLISGEVNYSQRYLEILGYKNNNLKLSHADILKHLHPEDLPVRKKAFEDAMKTGTLNYESRIIWNDGSIHWIEGKGKMLYDENNHPLKLIGVVRDLTEDKNYQKILQESEEKFRLLADSMPQLVWTVNAEGHFNYFNKSILNYSGLDPESISRDEWEELIHPDDRNENNKKWNESIASGKEFIYEHRLKRADGEYRWQLSHATPQRDKDGKIKMWVGTSTDIESQKQHARELENKISERTKELKELNKALAKSEERYHLMVEEVQDYAIIYLSPEGIVENWNKGAEKIKGYHSEEIIGKCFSVFYTENDRKNNLPFSLLDDARKTGKAVKQGWRVRKDKSRFWASTVISVINDEKGNVIGFTKVTHDLTDKKHADDKLKMTAEQLEQKNRDLEKMNAELQSFAYVSSHDLQEPLRKIQAFASRIVEKEEQNLSVQGKDYFNRMQMAAGRMQTLIKDLLAYSRTSTADRVFVKSDLNEIINDAKIEFKETLTEKNGTIESDVQCECYIIPFQFRQLIINLISNSLKFSHEGIPPVIKISCKLIDEDSHLGMSRKEQVCHIVFEDNGIGFDPKYKERIFEIFQRLHGRTEYKGTGIGLAIVKKIVENHSGFIEASGEPGKGARFDIYLPLKPGKNFRQATSENKQQE